MSKDDEILVQQGSGNVYADLGLKDSDELFKRGQIGIHILEILKNRKLKQREVSDLFEIPQPEVSHLMNGHFSRFTIDKLLDFLQRLDRKVTITISRHKQGEPYHEVECAL